MLVTRGNETLQKLLSGRSSVRLDFPALLRSADGWIAMIATNEWYRLINTTTSPPGKRVHTNKSVLSLEW
jgi:hypothetical protein